jgi:hypothetical protein
MMTMPCLAIRQPWAWAIFHSGKDIENRTRSTRYRGPLLILASKNCLVREWMDFYNRMHDPEDPMCELTSRSGGLPELEKLPRGGIVGIVDLVDCVSGPTVLNRWYAGESVWSESKETMVRNYGLRLANPRPLPFTRCTGRLGIFDVDTDAIGLSQHIRRAA